MISSAQASAEDAEIGRIDLARQQAHATLEWIGWIVIGLFVFDLIESAAAWARHHSSRVDLLPLIGGIILIRGGLRPVRTVRFIAGVTMVAGLLMDIYTTWAPPRLIITEIHLHDFSRELGFVTGCLYALVAMAVYRGTCSESVEVVLRAEFGAPGWWSNPVLGPLTGLLLSLFIIALGTINKPNFDIALNAARAKYGDSYQYIVTGWQVQNDDWNVEVEGYNTDSIKKADVEITDGRVRKVTTLP